MDLRGRSFKERISERLQGGYDRFEALKVRNMTLMEASWQAVARTSGKWSKPRTKFVVSRSSSCEAQPNKLWASTPKKRSSKESSLWIDGPLAAFLE